MKKISMANIRPQFINIRSQVLSALEEVLESGQHIQGLQIKELEKELSHYLYVGHTISCGSGTAALQVILMSLGLKPGDEIVVPAFTYASVAEVACLLGLRIIPVDVKWGTFNIDPVNIEIVITPRTKAIVAVHLFGQCADINAIMDIAKKHSLHVIEDVAQSFGAKYKLDDGSRVSAGSIGHINYTSFFPTKNLGCYGDGGAIFTENSALANRARMVATHGQSKKYYHDYIGINSRLDSIQAAILLIKLKHLDREIKRCQEVAHIYNNELEDLSFIECPKTDKNTSHTFHQYVLKVNSNQRDLLQKFLTEKKIPTAIYYPLAIYEQRAFKEFCKISTPCSITEKLCESTLAIPMHSEMTSDQIGYICHTIKSFTRHV